VEAPQLTHHRRGVKAIWVKRFFHELTTEEQAAVARGLGEIPHDHAVSDAARLLERARTGELGMLGLPDDDGQLAAVAFFLVEECRDGSKNFHLSGVCSLVGHTTRRLAAHDMDQFAKVARELGCGSMSLRTIRPGLLDILCPQGWFISTVNMTKLL